MRCPLLREGFFESSGDGWEKPFFSVIATEAAGCLPESRGDVTVSKIVEALQSVVVITPAISIWSGRVTVKRQEDLASAAGLPPESLVSDGAKRVIDPKHLTPLETHRRGVDRYLARVGSRHKMGFVISPDQEDEVHKELADREAAFNQAKAELVSNYDLFCLQWENQNAGYEGLLRRNRPTVLQVSAACEFDYATFRLTQAESAEGKRRFETLGKDVVTGLIEDVSQSADRLISESFHGRAKVTQRAVNVARELVQKLRNFSRFDPRLGVAADALAEVLKGVRSKGPLDPTEAMIVTAMLTAMSDPDKLLAYGQQFVSGAADQEPEEEVEADDSELPVVSAMPPAGINERRFVPAVF